MQQIVSRNPYQLAKDIRGIGFISADTIANNLGIELGLDYRIYCLKQLLMVTVVFLKKL